MASVSPKLIALVLAAIVVSAGGWHWYATRENDQIQLEGPSLPNVSSTMVPFVIEFHEVDFTPDSPSYQLPLAPEQVLNLDSVVGNLSLGPLQLEFLMRNGIVGVAHPEHDYITFKSAFSWTIGTAHLPVFITSDSVLDTYHLIFDRMLRILEEDQLYEQARYLSYRMMMLSDQQRGGLSGERRTLAEENVVFFGVPLRILDPDAHIPMYAEQDVGTIVSMICEASGRLVPPGFEHQEDFTQYKPRGHYTNSQRLSDYFRAMMWYGRLTFRGAIDHETQRAVLASWAMAHDEAASSAYLRLSTVVSFIVGAPDDLTCFEYADVAEQVFGAMGTDFGPLFDESDLVEFRDRTRDLRPPRICSDIAGEGEEYWGLRVLGQSFVWDSYVFQQCVHPNVYGRYIPSGLDVMAALGSDEAWEREPFEAFQPMFEGQLGDVREELSQLGHGDWSESLYTAWLHALQPLHSNTTAEGYPPFMRTEAWRAKELNTQMASWTQLTHDTLLYRKQTAVFSLGSPHIPMPNITYVEPVPKLYSRMASMVRATSEGLSRLSLASKDVLDRLYRFEKDLEVLERVSIQQLTGEQPSREDMDACRYFYQVTEWQSYEWTEDSCYDSRVNSRSVLVGDVHTVHLPSPDWDTCLEEGVGHIRFLVVVIPHRQGPLACVGPVFEHYEFSWPLHKGRLTDEEWEAMLADGSAPDPAPWAQDFMV